MARRGRRVVMAFGIFVASAASAVSQTIKATITSPLEASTPAEWARDLGYNANQLYPLALGSTGCPLVGADVAGTVLSLMFDTGTARGFVITRSAPAVPHGVEGRTEELNADGSHRGESLLIRVDSMLVAGKVFRNVTGTLSDWQMFSSEPFDGTVGLDFFRDRRVTLDYRSLKLGVTAVPIPGKLDPRRYIILDLIDPPKSQGSVLYARGRVNGRESVIYFDTGYSVSFIDPAFVAGLPSVKRPGRFTVFRQRVPLEMGQHTFILNEVREDAIRRGTGLDLPVALTLGSDVLSHFIVTIDVRAKKLILGVPK